MRNTRVALLLFISCFSMAWAQSPTDGQTQANSYINSYFHFVYKCPQILHPVDTASIKTQPPANSTKEFLLFSAQQGSEPFGIMILAEKPNFHRQLPSGITESEDLIEHIKKWWDPKGQPIILSETHFKNPSGLIVYDLEYMIFGEYDAAVVTQIGEFQIVFRCNAKSREDLMEMTRSAGEIQLQK